VVVVVGTVVVAAVVVVGAVVVVVAWVSALPPLSSPQATVTNGRIVNMTSAMSRGLDVRLLRCLSICTSRIGNVTRLQALTLER
jgi:hypothetical protein